MKRKISIYTAAAIVVANMIGTGVFTSVGFQLSAVQNTWSIMLLWLTGGLLSLFGAFAYAELGTHFKESGGDYIYLSRVFHPLLGYLSAWAGLTVGFSAPVALAAMAFTKYLAPFGLQNNVWLAIAVIVLIGLMHSFTIRHSSRFQNLSTIVKVVFIVTLIGLGFFTPNNINSALNFGNSWQREVLKPGFAVSMVYVAFAYTGWNAAAYVVDEIKDPHKNLPKALIASTLFVAVVYLLFQFVLLKNATVTQLAGKEEVTFISFDNLLGSAGGKWVSVFIGIQLIATVSSYLWVGPRVTMAMAKENKLWQPLAKKNAHGIPVAAVWLHVFISILLALTGSFEKILLYAGFVLQLMASLTVATSIFIKDRQPHTFSSPFRPWLQIIFLLFNTWVLVFTIIERPLESLIGIGIILAGAIIYYFDSPQPGEEAVIPG
ncbi:amino acid permease [Ferruginibacter paludis]|uniref:APC family permease n=1 Tax=Ferruginibacter paludis TaxID=1310417 RepID=UPI0025B55042|nr:amino acid permease [Ferruginibacter paludis]MDN3658124.1 amino acid permease [Ferruginibacter paludis]